MRSSTTATLVLAALLLAVPAGATLCSLDNQPGASLLLPYFEVDLGDPSGLTTFFTVVNTSSEPVVVRVVLWTDAAFPTLAFDVSLEGHDLQPFNLRDLLAGRLPGGASLGGGEDCPGVSAPLNPDVTSLAEAHTGQAVPELGGLCAGFDHKDTLARGYATVDVIHGCSTLLPSDPGYFGLEGTAGYDNVLQGDFFFLDPTSGRTEGDRLVSLEASATAYGPGDMTFYGRYVGDSGADGREPLSTLWSNRYLGGGPFSITSTSLVWRDTGALPEAFGCDGEPGWYPLGYSEIASFDEDGDAIYWSTDVQFIVPPEPPFPAAAQRGVGRRTFPSGWEIYDLNPPGERLQTYMIEVIEASTGASYMRPHTPIDDACSVGSCAFTEIGAATRFCINGTAGGLRAGQPISVEVFPAGCFSSGCTKVYRSVCRLRAVPGGLEAAASFCLRDLSKPGVFCTEDCGGAGSTSCSYEDGLPAGDYTLRLGDVELSFSVPMDLPAMGLCADAGTD